MKNLLVLTAFLVSVSVLFSQDILTVSLKNECLDILRYSGLDSELESRFERSGMKLVFVDDAFPLESLRKGDASAVVWCGDVPESTDLTSGLPLLALKLSLVGDERPPFLGTTMDLAREAKCIFPKSTIVVFDNLEDAVKALKDEDVDAVFHFEYSLLKRGISKVNLKEISYTRSFLNFLFPIDSRIRRKVDSLILEMYKDETLANSIEGKDGLERANILRLAVEEWPPYEFLEGGRWVGTDVEIVEAVLKKLGYDLKLRYYPPLRALRMLASGILDGAFSLEKIPEREIFLEYIDVPLSSGSDVFFTLKKPDLDENFSPEILEDSLCGYAEGYAGLEIMKRFCSRVITIPNVELGMRLLVKGRIDAFIANRFVGNFFARKLGVLDRIVESSVVRSYGYYLVLSRSSPHVHLVDFLREALEEFKTSPDYFRILRKYGVELDKNER